ncbi:MAG: 2-oxoadipate dioxygenase/decarboxylase family protein [Acidimicrobiales bacterium]
MSRLTSLVAAHLGDDRAAWLVDNLELHPALAEPVTTRAVVAQALGMLLLDDLLGRVPSGAAYSRDRAAAGYKIHLDHGAVRTVTGVDCGELPPGQESLTRALGALGYEHRYTYDLSKLKMTGRSWCHLDLPADVVQYFVSELHADRFSEPFQAVAAGVLSTSKDPITPDAARSLTQLAADRSLPYDEAEALLPVLVACFQRQHDLPSVPDYEALLAESDEMAWISTEGTSFNHATDRVDDVVALAETERNAGRPIKDKVEVSGSGRIIQTAHRAAPVERTFRTGDNGSTETRTVPGSFFEFITRKPLPDGSGIDLAFDAANAQEIFTMTRGRSSRN